MIKIKDKEKKLTIKKNIFLSGLILKPKIDIPYTSIIKYDGLEDTDG